MVTQPARGMRDFLPEDVRRREYVVRVIRDVYDRYGFEPLETPAVENIDTLVGKYGDEGNKLIFKILKRGEHEASGQADLALRYDLTVPLARVVAEYQAKLPKFFKRYQIQPVWRADRPARGRFREFYQCDIDAIGSGSLVVEAEMCAAASDALTQLGFTDFTIRLNHRGLLTLVLQVWFGLPPSRHAEALITLDKLDKIGWTAVTDELDSRHVVARSVALKGLEMAAGFIGVDDNTPALAGLRQAVSHPAKQDPNLDIQKLRQLREAILSTPALRLDPTPIDDLISILQLTQSTAAAGRMRHDIFLARGLSYYTGAIMEVSVPDLAGSLGGGGRYDNLIGTFLGRDVPACGFSLGLERILVVMDERKMFPESIVGRNADVMVTLWDDASQADALALAASLRRADLRVDVYPEPDKLGKQFKYASSRGIPFVTVVGDDEKAAGSVMVKDLRSGAQQAVSMIDVPDYVSKRLARTSG